MSNNIPASIARRLAASMFLFTIVLFAQEEPVIVTGNELIGRVENGMSIREVNGQVVLQQGNVVITCNRAIQYLATNNAKLIGNVVVHQDTLTIRTSEGYYYGNEKRAFSDKGVILDDKKVTLTSRVGEYFFKLSKADFRFQVQLKDSVSTLNADRLFYFRKENKAIAMQNVRITDTANTIFADSLVHFRAAGETFGFGNVLIQNNRDGIKLFGNNVVDRRKQKYTLIDKEPLLVKVDSVFSDSTKELLNVDTLLIRSKIMEAKRDSLHQFIAKDSVRILRGTFASNNDYTIYHQSDGSITTYKIGAKGAQPVMWQELSQLTGDSIFITLKDNAIEHVDVTQKALILSQSARFAKRYDQIAAEKVSLFFKDNKLSSSKMFNNVLSVYFVYDEEDEPNGLIKASSRNAEIHFVNNKVDEVRLFTDTKSEYHPENLVGGKERQFYLPQFKVIENRPDKLSLTKHYQHTRAKF